MKGVFEFALNDGHTCRLEAEYECVMERDVLDADGYKIELEEKPSDSGKMTAFVDGKKVDDCRNTNSWGLIKIPKGKKIDGLRIGFASEETAQQYEKWISELIENGTSEEVKEYRAREEEKKLKKRIEAARELIERAEKQGDIPSHEQAMRRRKAWNDIYNEGGFGFVPQYVCQEEYEAAKALLNDNGYNLSKED